MEFSLIWYGSWYTPHRFVAIISFAFENSNVFDMLDDTNFTPTWECAHDCGSNGNSESKSGGEHPKVNVTTFDDAADDDNPCCEGDPRPFRASYARVAESVPAPASNASVPAPTILDVALNPSSR